MMNQKLPVALLTPQPQNNLIFIHIVAAAIGVPVRRNP
jgi:hypothetical protein